MPFTLSARVADAREQASSGGKDRLRADDGWVFRTDCRCWLFAFMPAEAAKLPITRDFFKESNLENSTLTIALNLKLLWILFRLTIPEFYIQECKHHVSEQREEEDVRSTVCVKSLPSRSSDVYVTQRYLFS